MENKFIYDEPIAENIFSDEMLSDSDRIPSEKDPFCNETEEISYNEDYSHIVPGFFFRNIKCDLKPVIISYNNIPVVHQSTGLP